MEKKLHDDHLDDYVRKSFEGYEEAPGADMWDRIEPALPPTEEDRKRPVLWWARIANWRMAAAALLLLLVSTLVCGRLYYERKLEALRQQQSPATEQSLPQPVPGTAPGTAPDGQQANSPRKQGEAPAPAPNADPAAVAAQDRAAASETSIFKTQAVENQIFAKNKKTQESPGNGTLGIMPEAVRQVETAAAAAPSLPLQPALPSGASEPPNPGIATDSPIAAALPSPKGQRPAIAPTIATRYPQSANSATIPSLAPPPRAWPIAPRLPQATAGAASWYLGLQIMPGIMREKAPNQAAPPNRPRLVSQRESSGAVFDYWLILGKKLAPNWGIETGLGYRDVSRSATHAPRFRFRDGNPHQGGGPGMRSFDFRYDLDNYGGSTEVTLRMEQVDPTATIPDNEPLNLRIRTTERTQLLRLPLLLRYKLGDGPLQGVLKGGLVGNFIVHCEMDITTRASENARLRPTQTREGYTLNRSNPRAFFLGYQVSAGLAYTPAKRWALLLEPTFSADFARKNALGNPLPTQRTLSLNAGLNYFF
jgi:hypothetical protein